MPNGKNKKVVLVTAIGGDIGSSYVKSVAGEEFSLVGCDMKPASCSSLSLELIFQVPSADQQKEYLNAIKNIMEEAEVDLIVPISEPEIEAFHKNRQVWSTWGVEVLINNEFILNHFLDKYKTVKYLSSIGIKTPDTYLLTDYQDQLEKIPHQKQI